MININSSQEPVGYVRFAVHPNDSTKGWIQETVIFDERLKEHILGFADRRIESLIDMNEVLNIKPDVADTLLLVLFSYSSFSYTCGELEEWEDRTTVQDVIILKRRYQEQWRTNLLEQYGFLTAEEAAAHKAGITEIEDWEGFYETSLEQSLKDLAQRNGRIRRLGPSHDSVILSNLVASESSSVSTFASSNQLKSLENAVNYLQKNDRHGDFRVALHEYRNGTLPEEILYEILTRTLVEWRDEHLAASDDKDRQDINQLLKELEKYRK